MKTKSTGNVIVRCDWVALALENCTLCHGTGIRSPRSKSICDCTYRNIFRAVMNKVYQCAAGYHLVQPIRLDGVSKRVGARSCGRKSEEYAADVYLTAQRTLTEIEWNVFRFHILLGADWRLCSRRFGMDRGTFYHALYRMERKLGRVFLELRPYALFPIDSYFQPRSVPVDIRPFPLPIQRQGSGPLRPPVRSQPDSLLARV